MPQAVCHAYAFSLVGLGEPVVATVLMTCFYGTLRISEALAITRANVFARRGSVAFYFGSTKRGEEEVVVIESRHYLRWFRAYR